MFLKQTWDRIEDGKESLFIRVFNFLFRGNHSMICRSWSIRLLIGRLYFQSRARMRIGAKLLELYPKQVLSLFFRDHLKISGSRNREGVTFDDKFVGKATVILENRKSGDLIWVTFAETVVSMAIFILQCSRSGNWGGGRGLDWARVAFTDTFVEVDTAYFEQVIFFLFNWAFDSAYHDVLFG